MLDLADPKRLNLNLRLEVFLILFLWACIKGEAKAQKLWGQAQGG